MTCLPHSLLLILSLITVANAAGRSNQPLQLGKVTPDRAQVPRYGRVEFTLDLQGDYDNAFDPQQIEVNGRFRTPDGKIIAVPGFYFQDYTHELKSGNEVMTPHGAPGWRIRFSPSQIGRYSLLVTAKDSTGKSATSKPIEFECVPSGDPGFVRISKSDKRYFAFDNDRPYVPIGANVCWAYGPGLFSYETWLPKYERAGCNYVRLWLGLGWTTFALEKTSVAEFDLANAWRLDQVLDMASKRGMYVMLCLDSYNELRKTSEGAYPYWDQTPHNAANGGPLKEPREFWTDPTMLRLYRNKLRYLVARYGWDTRVMSWEFWNEVDIISPTAYIPDEVTRWHAEMSDYLRSIDPWKHLRTTSFAGSDGKPEIDRLPQIDYVQTHNYGSRDIAASLTQNHRKKEAYGKPHYVGEFGTDAGGGDGIAPEAIALHNGIWSTLMSGSAGSAMLWWWDNRIEPGNLYGHFAALSSFIKGVDFPKESFRRIENAAFTSLEPGKPSYADLIITGPASWEPSTANRPTTVRVGPKSVAVEGEVAGILHGNVNHPTLHNPVTFEMNLPHATRLQIRVSGVSGYGGAHLIAELDGVRVLDKDMPDPGTDPKHETMRGYDGVYTVKIPAGEHKVMVEDIGTDWLLVNYLLEKAELSTSPDLRLFGLRGNRTSLLWIQNSQNTWYRVSTLKRAPEPQPPGRLKIPGWPSGRYQVKFWDTYTGKETDMQELTVGPAGLEMELPSITKDIALRIEKL